MVLSKVKKTVEATIVIGSILLVTGTSAQAQIKGISYSRGGNVPDIGFDLVFKKTNATIINDESIANNSGLFVGAIENFSYLGSAIPNPSTAFSPLSFDFTNGNLSTSLNGNIVTYTIIATQPFLILDYDQATTGTLSTVINPNPVYTFDVDISGFNAQDQIKAVNDLKFIAEKNLYALSDLSDQSFISSTFNGLTLGVPSASAGLRISKIIDKTIPEPSFNIALITLGLFGTNAILRRKLAQN
jgi:hypothetical protein